MTRSGAAVTRPVRISDRAPDAWQPRGTAARICRDFMSALLQSAASTASWVGSSSIEGRQRRSSADTPI
eukprot:356411-Chlamydomonas_euryale.AAC.9